MNLLLWTYVWTSVKMSSNANPLAVFKVIISEVPVKLEEIISSIKYIFCTNITATSFRDDNVPRNLKAVGNLKLHVRFTCRQCSECHLWEILFFPFILSPSTTSPLHPREWRRFFHSATSDRSSWKRILLYAVLKLSFNIQETMFSMSDRRGWPTQVYTLSSVTSPYAIKQVWKRTRTRWGYQIKETPYTGRLSGPLKSSFIQENEIGNNTHKIQKVLR